VGTNVHARSFGIATNSTCSEHRALVAVDEIERESSSYRVSRIRGLQHLQESTCIRVST